MSKTITIGPYHPDLLEPSRFDLTVENGRISQLDLTLGYVNRAVEELMTKKTYRQNVVLAERICGICSSIHTLAFCQAVERLAEIQVPPRAAAIRTITAELERLHSHYLSLGMLAHALHAGEHFGRIMGEREKLVALIERLSGNRVHYAVNTIGGVRRDLSAEQIADLRATMDALEPLSRFLLEALGSRGALGKQVAGVGVLSSEDARALGTVGPVMRGSGIQSDIRQDEPYAAYPQVRFTVAVERDGDVRARSMVRAREIAESISIIRQLVEALPESPLVGELHALHPNETRETLERVEAPRGELAYYLRSNGTNMPERVKIRTPTFANLPLMRRAAVGEEPERVRTILESLDPCLSCTDR